MIGYPSKDEYILSFPVNAEVTVYSKDAGTNKDLWGVEVSFQILDRFEVFDNKNYNYCKGR